MADYSRLAEAMVPTQEMVTPLQREVAGAGASGRLSLLLGLGLAGYNGYNLYRNWGKSDEQQLQDAIENNRRLMHKSPMSFDDIATDRVALGGDMQAIPPEWIRERQEDNWNPERMKGFPGLMPAQQALPYDSSRAFDEYVKSGRYWTR